MKSHFSGEIKIFNQTRVLHQMHSYLIENTSQVLTMAGAGWEPLKGDRMRRLRIRENSSVLLDDGQDYSIYGPCQREYGYANQHDEGRRNYSVYDVRSHLN